MISTSEIGNNRVNSLMPKLSTFLMSRWGSMIKYISIFLFIANNLFSIDKAMSALVRMDQGFIDYANSQSAV